MARPSKPIRTPLASRLREAAEAETKAARATERAAGRVTTLIRKARDEGYSLRAIAAATGLPLSVVHRRAES